MAYNTLSLVTDASLPAPHELFSDNVIQFTSQSAPLLADNSAAITYGVAHGVTFELQPMLYVAGFNDVYQRFDNKFPLASNLGGYGLGMHIAQNHRDRILKNPATNKPDAMYTQAQGVLSMIEAEGLADTTLPAAGHSMGGMVLTMAIQEAKRLGWRCFDNAPVALLASAGLNRKETIFSLSNRFTSGLYTERHANELAIEPTIDTSKIMDGTIAGGFTSARANLSLSAREISELGRRRINLRRLAAGVGELAIVNYAHDVLQPSRLTDVAVAELFDGPDAPTNVRYLTPYSTKMGADGEMIGARGAQHLDCVTCPTRVGDTVASFLLAA